MVKRSVLAAALLLACRPDVEGGASVIGAPRVLAIRATPAEAQPGATVTWSALYASPAAEESFADLSWALCTDRKPIAVAGPISLSCLEPEGEPLVQLGTGESVSGKIAADVCRVFGPSPPAPKAGEPTARPADPDSSGGYYQPLRIHVGTAGDDYAVALTRIGCGVSGATVDQSIDYAKRYRPNENPALDAVLLDPDGAATPLSDDASAPTVVAPGAALALRASWAECPLSAVCGDGICGAGEDRTNCADDCREPHGCTGSEPYVQLDPLARRIVERRESMRVSWFATSGSFEHDRSGVTEEGAAATQSDNRWTAPPETGDVRVWVVLRDDRGGVGYRSYFVRVE